MAHHHFFVEAQANYGALLASERDKAEAAPELMASHQHTKKDHKKQLMKSAFTSVSFDAPIKYKTLQITGNVLISLALLIALQLKGWDGQIYYRGFDPVSEALRCGMLVLSLFLIYQLYNRQKFIMGVALYKAERERAQRLHEKRRKERKKIKEKLRRKGGGHKSHHPKTAPPPLPKIPKPTILQEVDPWKVKLKFPPPWHVLTHESYMLLPTMFFCLILPYPFVQYLQRMPSVQSSSLSHWMDDEVGLLMFFRLAVFVWVLRENSVLWVNRHTLVAQAAKYTSLRMAPKFDTWFAIKAIYLGQPAKFIGVLFFSQWVVLSYVIWILEREENTNGLIEFQSCIILAGMVILFTWPDDAWSVISVQTVPGKFACSIGVCTGLLVLTLVLGIAANQLIPTPFEKNALNFCNLQASKRQELDAAARLIQFVWRARTNWNRIMEEEAAELREAREADRAGQNTKLWGWACGDRNQNVNTVSGTSRGSRASSKMLIEDDEEEEWEDEGDEGDDEEEITPMHRKKRREPGFREAIVKKKYEKVWAQDEIKWQEGLFKLIQNFQRWRRLRAELGSGVEKIDVPSSKGLPTVDKPLCVSPDLQRQIDLMIQEAVKAAVTRVLSSGEGSIKALSPCSSNPQTPRQGPVLLALNSNTESLADEAPPPNVLSSRSRAKISPAEDAGYGLERHMSSNRLSSGLSSNRLRWEGTPAAEEEKRMVRRHSRSLFGSTGDESEVSIARSLSSDLEGELSAPESV